MKVRPIIFKFEEDKNDLLFDEQINFVDDKKLIKTLEKENIKNEGSSLIIKSMNDLPIYDVIQLKINVSETGSFLVSFDKTKIDEKIREKLLASITELRSDAEINKDNQLKKIKKLLIILDRYNPIYATYKSANDTIIITDEDFKELISDMTFAYPLFIIKREEKPTKIHVLFKKKEKPTKPKSEGEAVGNKKERKEIVIDFPLFTIDYLFNTLFVLLFGFGMFVGIFEILNKENISTFLLILSAIFLFICYYTIYDTLYKKHEEKYKGQKYWILIYLITGAVLGIVIGYVISKFALKVENSINFNLIFAISIPSVSVLSLAGIFAARLINFVLKKIQK